MPPARWPARGPSTPSPTTTASGSAGLPDPPFAHPYYWGPSKPSARPNASRRLEHTALQQPHQRQSPQIYKIALLEGPRGTTVGNRRVALTATGAVCQFREASQPSRRVDV